MMRLAMAFVICCLVRYEDFQGSLRREVLVSRHTFEKDHDEPQVTNLK
jgi:hypothetical protein